MALSGYLRICGMILFVSVFGEYSKQEILKWEKALPTMKDPTKIIQLSTIIFKGLTRVLEVMRTKRDILKLCTVFKKGAISADSEEENIVVREVDNQEMDKLVTLCDMRHGPNSMDSSTVRSKRWTTVEDTLWCGFGNDAGNNTTLFGPEIKTDKCCMQHDTCTPFIDAWSYGQVFGSVDLTHLFNSALWAKHQCSTCNRDFYDCLKNTNSDTAAFIGEWFFNYLDIGCFDLVSV